MPYRSFRFIHAADLHLEQTPGGVAYLPDHLTDLFLDAPYTAARRVFEAVCSEQADLLVLSGNVLDARRTGPRGPLFLVEQFEKLAARDIPVFWAGGTLDSPDVWPASVRLPDNVVVFPQGKPEEVTFDRDAEPIVRLLGASRVSGRKLRPNEFSGEPGGLFTIAVAHGGADPQSLKHREIEYWALGGRGQRQTLFRGTEVAHYPGTPQGRKPSDSGQFGCTLVDVDERKTIRSIQIETGAFQWHNERVEIEPGHSHDDVQALLRERLSNLAQTHASTDVMVTWQLGGSGKTLAELRRGPVAEELLGKLRKEFGFGRPTLWSVKLEPEARLDVPEVWLTEESIRGDFLRAVQALESESAGPIDLTEYLPERYLAGSLSAAAVISDPAERQRVLAEAAMLGVDLLTPEETVS